MNVNNKKKIIIGYNVIGDPVYNPNPDRIHTNSPIICHKCNRKYSEVGGPVYLFTCNECFEKLV